MSDSKLRIVVSGLIAQYPLGGVAWDYLQYVLGLARLGHDVFYVEDTGQWPYNPQTGGMHPGCEFNVGYLSDLMERFGLSDRWFYRAQSGDGTQEYPWKSQWYGLPDPRRKEVVRTADLLLNVSGTLERPSEYRDVGCLAYIDSDPVFTQMKLASGQEDSRRLVDLHDVHFSFGECHSEAVPATGHDWLPTRQPVILSEWDPRATRRDAFTTVMNWTSYNPVIYQGKTYGQKDVEFEKFIDLPASVAPTVLEIAVNEGKTRRTPRTRLAAKGWVVRDPAEVCPDLDSYRRYVESSKAEWSVAKNGYVEGRAGWFSCRSACYLAAGRPVVVQDTGFSDVLPVGEGILAFTDPDGAVAGIREVEARYERHARAARAIAEEFFEAGKVLSALTETALRTTAAGRTATRT
jgi:hypothetical protein